MHSEYQMNTTQLGQADLWPVLSNISYRARQCVGRVSPVINTVKLSGVESKN